MYNLSELKRNASIILDGLENAICGAANEISRLDIPYSYELADLVMGKRKLVNIDVKDYKTQKSDAYEKWMEDMKKVDSILKRYMGNDAHFTAGEMTYSTPLDDYLEKIEKEPESRDYTESIGIDFPGLEKLKKIEEALDIMG